MRKSKQGGKTAVRQQPVTRLSRYVAIYADADVRLEIDDQSFSIQTDSAAIRNSRERRDNAKWFARQLHAAVTKLLEKKTKPLEKKTKPLEKEMKFLEKRVRRSLKYGRLKVAVLHGPFGRDIETLWACPATSTDAVLSERGLPTTPVDVLLLNNALVPRDTWGALVTVRRIDGMLAVTSKNLLRQLRERKHPRKLTKDGE